jgi:hypothetical protein
MKKFFVLLLFLVIFGGGYYAYLHRDEVAELLPTSNREETVDTFETAISPEELLSQHSKTLLPTKQHTFGSSTLHLAPHLLLQMKYSPDGRTTIATSMLWDMIDGELVLDTNSFDHTQGFADCITSKANADDFRILQLLTKKGALSKEQLSQELGTDNEMVCDRVENLRKRHLVIVANDIVRVHVESPLLRVDPLTTITRPFVQRKVIHKDELQATYSKAEIEQLVKAAFGQDVAIRSSRLIFVPIYEIQVLNPDSSVRRTFWNAISGKELWKQHTPSVIAGSR